MTISHVKHSLFDSYARGSETSSWTLELFTRGSVNIRTNHGEVLYVAPCAMLIPPHVAYSEIAALNGEWTEYFAIFDPPSRWSSWLEWPQSDCRLGLLNLSDSTVCDEVVKVFETAIDVQRSSRANRQLLASNALERVLLLLDEVNPLRGLVMRDERIEQVLCFVASHYHEPLSLETLAQHAYLSPSRFSHLFKQQLQQTPLQFVENYRLERAAEKLLQSSQIIEHIAHSVGFTNAFHFSTRFRRHFGQSPSQYRRNPHVGE